MLPFILEECPNALVVHGGTNDLRKRDRTAEQIADDLINIGVAAQSLGVENVLFSSLVIRQDGVTLDRKRTSVNRILRDKCHSFNNFYFIDNSNILWGDIDEYDGIHLYEKGTIKLANNVINALNGLC